MAETVLVTGAEGFVGGHVVPALHAAGFTVHPHRRALGDLAAGPLTAPHADWVIHLAGRTFVPASWSQPFAFYRDNVLATASVLEYCRQTGAALVHMSSYVYGNPVRLPIDEDHPLQPFNPYAHSKILAEDVVRFYGATFGVRAVILRPFNLYGSGQPDHFLIATVVRQAVDPAADTIVVGDLRPRRDYLHVRDLVALVLAALRTNSSGVYNAGSGHSISVADVIDEVQSIANVRKPVRATESVRTGDILDVVADVSRSAADLGWRPEVSLGEGLRETLDWMARTRPVG